MVVKLNGKEYMVQWHHRYPKVSKHRKLSQRGETVEVNRGGTSCILWEIVPSEHHKPGYRATVAEVHLTRYYKDMFSKESGRKYSLAAVLRGMGFSRDERKVFWDTYFARKNTEVTV